MFKELYILRPFFDNPTKEFNVRELAKLVGIVPATASKKLKELERKKILKYRKERILDLYKAYIDSAIYRDIKLYYTLTKIRESGIIEALDKQYIKPTIILFGSNITGLDTETSDIDLAIISENTEEFKQKIFYEKKLGRELQVFIIKNIKELKNPHLINNILNGIILQGEIIWT